MYWLVTWSRYFYEKFVIIIDRKWWTLLTHYSNHRVETVKQEVKWSEILFCSESQLSGTDQKAGVKTTVMKGHYTARHLLLISKHDTDHFILHKSGQINILLTVSPSCPLIIFEGKIEQGLCIHDTTNADQSMSCCKVKYFRAAWNSFLSPAETQ